VRVGRATLGGSTTVASSDASIIIAVENVAHTVVNVRRDEAARELCADGGAALGG